MHAYASSSSTIWSTFQACSKQRVTQEAPLLALHFPTQQKLVLLKLEEFTLELRGNNVSLGQECFF